jgi:hypothetical protein
MPTTGTAIAANFLERLIQNSFSELAVRPTSPDAGFRPGRHYYNTKIGTGKQSFLSLPAHRLNTASGLVWQKIAATASLT